MYPSPSVRCSIHTVITKFTDIQAQILKKAKVLRLRCQKDPRHTFYFGGFVDLVIFLSLLSSHVVYML